MSTFDVLAQAGTARLLRFLGLVLLFVTLHLTRLPFVLIGRLLEAAMRRVDVAVSGQVSDFTRPAGGARQTRATAGAAA